MASREEIGVGKILLVLGAFLVVGVPIVAVLWHAMNEAAAGDLRRLLVAVPMLLIFVGFLIVFGRGLERLERRR